MYDKLLEPDKIGFMPLRNHILMGPTETHFTRADGCISQEEIAYYVERAKGGAALITTQQIQGNTKIDPMTPILARQGWTMTPSFPFWETSRKAAKARSH